LKIAKAQWQNEKNSVDTLSRLREQINGIKTEIELAQSKGDYEKAGKLQYQELPELEKRLECTKRVQ
jgi:ATP-dependent Clp protease ATP-binding subunit ClpB